MVDDLAEEEDDEDDQGGFIVESQEEETSEVPDFAQSSIADIIRKVRKIVNWFNASPKQADGLRRYTKEELPEHVELTVLKDCKTRWSSLYFCLKRFYKIRDAN